MEPRGYSRGRYFDTGAIPAFGTFRKEIAAVVSYDAICIICFLSCANRTPPIAIPTKNTTANSKPVMPAFCGGLRANSPQLPIQKLLVAFVHHFKSSGNDPCKRAGTGLCSSLAKPYTHQNSVVHLSRFMNDQLVVVLRSVAPVIHSPKRRRI
jgi:hypothetical protein